jgi:hypothetical protein
VSKFKRRKAYLGSWFWRAQAKDEWIHCLDLRQDKTSWQKECDGVEMLTYLMAARKQRKTEGLG